MAHLNKVFLKYEQKYVDTLRPHQYLKNR